MFKLGLRRVVPIGRLHWSSMRRKYKLAMSPSPVDYLSALPDDVGMMGNDKLGDCIPGEVMVGGATVTGAYRAPYSGPIAILTTASGKKLPVTPNHAILTDHGFQRARLLHKGDNLISTRRPDIFPGTTSFNSKINLNQSPTPIEKIFSTISFRSDFMRKVMPIAVDFHGDEQFINGDVDVIRTNSFLRRNIYATLYQPYAHDKISATCKLKRHLISFGTALQRAFRRFNASFGDISFSSHGTTFGYAHAGIPQSLSLQKRSHFISLSYDGHCKTALLYSRIASNLCEAFTGHISRNQRRKSVTISLPCFDSNSFSSFSHLRASRHQPSVNGHITDARLPRNLFQAFPTLIETDSIRNVDFQWFNGHVYDLSTALHWFSANGIITHNCFEAAIYHGDQVRTLFADGAMVTQPDSDVIKLYELATGYTPSDPSTDNGSDAGQTLSFIEDNGIPEGPYGTPGKILVASFEIDPRNMSDVMEAMDACGGLMVGINATQNVMESKLWDYDPNSPVIGGHEIFCAKLLKPNANIGLISWGSPRYEMTQAFWANQVNQCTACVWQDWIEKTGKTPLGMTLDQLQSEMAAVGSGDIP